MKNSKLVLVFILLIIAFAPNSIAYATDIVRDITFPVNGISSFRDDFAEPRGDGTREHLGIDNIADKMTPIVSAVDGRVTYVVSPEASWGYSISIQDADGYSYRYLHINNDTPGTDDGQGGVAYAYAPGIKRGVIVKKGQHIAWVGDSGNAENTIPHLHFEIRKNRTTINPYKSLVKAAEESKFSASIKIGSAPAVNHPSDGDIPIDDLEYFFAEDLSLGATGPAVNQLQIRLASLGYFTAGVTDYFGPITQAAVVKYQLAKGISGTGFVGPITRSALNDGLIVPTTTSKPEVIEQNLFVGTAGEPVRQLQARLKTLGYFTFDITGYFGPITKEAVIKFQTANNIAPTGVVESITRGYLNGCTASAKFSTLTGDACQNLLPLGCTSNSGFSITTGQSCGTNLLPGCTSNTGYSVTTGKSCWDIQ